MNTLNTTTRLIAAVAALSVSLSIVQAMTGIAAQQRALAIASAEQPARTAVRPAAAEPVRLEQVAQAETDAR